MGPAGHQLRRAVPLHLPRFSDEEPPGQMQEQMKTPKQQSETRACGQGVVPQGSSDVALDAQGLFEAERLKLRQQHEQQECAQKEYELRKIEEQKMEQKTVQLFPANSGSLYQGPSKILGLAVRNVSTSDKGRSGIPHPAPSVHLESDMARPNMDDKHAEAIEQLIALSKSGPTRTESGKQDTPRRQKTEATETEAVLKMDALENEAPRQ